MLKYASLKDTSPEYLVTMVTKPSNIDVTATFNNRQICSLLESIMPLAEVEEILRKYTTEEDKLNKVLVQSGPKKETNVSGIKTTMDTSKIAKNLEEAKARNNTILRDLETVKATLRSRAIFSPTEMQWEAICKRYKEDPSLPVTTWKCHLPIYV